MSIGSAPAGLNDLLPGDVGFTTIAGRVGRLIDYGQLLLRDQSAFSHAYLVLPDGWLLEAMPRGARIVRLDGTDRQVAPRWGPNYAYGRVPLTDAQRGRVDALARVGLHAADGSWTPKLEGRPYGFADYLALALWEWQVPVLAPLVRGYVSNSERLICSQLVDFAWCVLGFHLWDDGRLPQDATPGGLFNRTLQVGNVWSAAA